MSTTTNWEQVARERDGIWHQAIAERDKARADLKRLRAAFGAALQSAVNDGVLPMEYAVTILAEADRLLPALREGPREP